MFAILPATMQAQTVVDFNDDSDLSYFYAENVDGSCSWDPSSGLSGSGAILTQDSQSVWTYTVGQTLEVGSTYSVSAYGYDSANSGFIGLGVSSSSTNAPATNAASDNGIAFVTHSGGYYKVNDGTSTSGSWGGDILAEDNWYKFALDLTYTGSNSFDVFYGVYASTSDGNIGSLLGSTTYTVSNATLGSASDLYFYFGTYGDRISTLDNFSTSASAVPEPAQTAGIMVGMVGIIGVFASKRKCRSGDSIRA